VAPHRCRNNHEPGTDKKQRVGFGNWGEVTGTFEGRVCIDNLKATVSKRVEDKCGSSGSTKVQACHEGTLGERALAEGQVLIGLKLTREVDRSGEPATNQRRSGYGKGCREEVNSAIENISELFADIDTRETRTWESLD